jgi:predicted transcriptional regulator
VSLVTVSQKRNRVYERRFDHELARSLRSEGMTYAEIARQVGVTPAAVSRVCDERVNARMQAQAKRQLYKMRKPCLGGCGRLVWQHHQSRTGYCRDCLQKKRDAERTDVRDHELRCARCKRWKPDEAFGPPRNQMKQTARRGRHIRCRDCESEIRRDHRRRKPDLYAESNRRSYIHKRKGAMTGYVVLRASEKGYEEVARVDAVSPTHAIESAVDKPGQYCAIKASAFKVYRVGSVQAFRVLPDPTLAEAVA